MTYRQYLSALEAIERCHDWLDSHNSNDIELSFKELVSLHWMLIKLQTQCALHEWFGPRFI